MGWAMNLKLFHVCAPVILVAACGVKEHPRSMAMTAESGGFPGGSGGVGGKAGGAGGATRPPDGGPALNDGGRTGGGGTGGGGGGGGSGSGGKTTTDARPDVAPSSGGGVTINGTQVPKSDVIVFLHIGHSNMAGRVTTPEELRPLNFQTHPQLWAYAKGGVWKPAKEPLSADSMNGSCGGVGCAGLPAGAGPGMSILRAALAAAPDKYMVSIGRGQSGLTAGFCRSFRKGGLLYDFVMGPAMELKGKVTFGGIWTMFGQSEINDASNNSRFGDCMVGIANDMRSDLGEPELPFVVGDWEEEAEGSLDTSSSTARVIIPQMRALPMRITRSVLIATDKLPMNPLDGQHYDLTGYKLWAERGFDLLTKEGWTPWAP
jgi:hypothetical protein